MRRHLITALFVSGWIIPSVEPGSCLALGASQQLTPFSDYRVQIYLAQCGWFSRGVTLDHIMERTHGRSKPSGPWIPGYLLGIAVALTGIVGNYHPRSRLVFLPWWMVVRPVLVVMAFHSFSLVWPIWCSTCLIVGYLAYSIFAICYKRKVSGVTDSVRSRRLIALSLLFFPLWVALLCVVQEVWPFLGWGLTLSAVLFLLFDREQRVGSPAEISADRGQVLGASPIR